MSKFHINKHGVPAPCRATKGNCPLGGADSHFDTIEDAQAHADEQNEQSHGLLPKVNQKTMQVQIPQKTFDAVFQNDFNNHGVQYTGPSNHDFNEMMNDSEMKEVYDSLPKEFHDKVKDEEYWVLVKSDNLKSHMVNHMIVPSEFGPEANKGYDAMLEEVGKYAPEHISNNELNWYGKGIDSKLSEDISEFATEQSLKESDLDINGQSFFVDTPKERNRNWAKEYFESGRYEDFKKANNINS